MSQRRLFKLLILICFLSGAGSVRADADIRVADTAALGGSSTIQYVASFTDCSNLTLLEVGSAGNLEPVDLNSLHREEVNSNVCTTTFSLHDAQRFEPSVRTIDRSGNDVTHTETFVDEGVPPSLVFDRVEITDEDDQQRLIVTMDADDLNDIAYLTFNVVGLRASDLRTSGGVVSEARKNAFALSGQTDRLYPSHDDQTIFQYSLLLDQSLSPQEIAYDAIILVDASVVDAAGNHTSISKVAFTGDSIQEEALALIVSSTSLIINNSLQSPVIVPAVEFQFRGVVSLPGLGNNVGYVSSHPDLVGVTQAGVVFAKQETGAIEVSITVSYPGLPSASIPVVVDFSKTLVAISLQGVDSENPLTLPSLNSYHSLPEIQGVFDDGSRTSIAGHWTPEITVVSAAAAFLDINDANELRANVAITDVAPAMILLSVRELSGTSSIVPVVARDGEPKISLNLPATITAPSELTIDAEVEDDVGVNKVQFYLDGAALATVENSPFNLVMPISEQFAGQTLNYSARVTDSAGQSTLSSSHQVIVGIAPEVVIPDYNFTLPINGQRVVESSPITLQLESSLGVLPEVESSSGIKNVDFYFDGTLVGSATYPGIEIREVKNPSGTPKQEMFEIWSAEVNSPSISTTQTSLSVGAFVSGLNGSDNAPTKLIRIIENSPPTATILTPSDGGQATVGENLSIRVEVVDDSLSLGAKVELLLNDTVVEVQQHTGSGTSASALMTDSTIMNFNLPITVEDLGSTLSLQARVTDYHQSVNSSSRIRVPVKADQAPTIAISHPINGASFVSGLPIQFRANAVDDIAIARVEFYVNSQLVGTDISAPYAFLYQTQENISVSQVLTISAKVYDSKGQEASGNIVEVTLGQDEEPPVVNISSPLITAVDSGESIAGVIEQSEFVIKVSGFDNVGVVKAQLRGVVRSGNRYLLTGNQNDVLTEDGFPVEAIPGVLRAYSALRLVSAPEYSNVTAAGFDPYPISISVEDEVGNSSLVEVVVAVYPDQAPEIVSVITDKTIYFSNDTVFSDILLRDDRAVDAVEIEYRLGESVLSSHLLNSDTGLVPMATLQVRDSFELSSPLINNEDQSLTITVTAYDELGQRSEELTKSISIVQDNTGPIATIFDPIPGTTLYNGDDSIFRFKAIDESGLRSVRIEHAGSVVYSSNLSGKQHQGQFNLIIPVGNDELIFDITAIDVLDNESNNSTVYAINQDQAPIISVRHPAAGSRLIEGEQLTINALISDNRSLGSVEIFVSENGQKTFSKYFSANQANQIIADGGYFSANLRVPHKPDGGDIEIIIEAIDNGGLTTQSELDIIILDDVEAPLINFTLPSNDLSLYPGESFNIEGIASDNIFINQLDLYLINESEEIKLDWEILTRTDRIEQIRVANTSSFGSVVAAERFFTDYEGRVRIPKSYTERANEEFDLVIRANDHGINEADSNSVKLTIKADDEAPIIVIENPSAIAIDRQKLSLEFSITDNVLNSSYTVSVIDFETVELLSETEINLDEVNIVEANLFDLNRYVPLASDGTRFTIVITATDTSGNDVTETRLVDVKPDTAPEISLTFVTPSDELVHGAVLFSRIEVVDDIVVDSHNSLTTFYSSLRGLVDPDQRNILHYNESSDSSEPQWLSFDYPEASEYVSGGLFINGHAFWTFDGATSRIDLNSSSRIDSLQFQLNDETVDYQVDLFSDDICAAEHQQVFISAADLLANNGDLSLAEFGSNFGRIIITPILQNGAQSSFLKQIRISKSELPASLEFVDVTTNRRVNTYNSLQLIVVDDAAVSKVGLISNMATINLGSESSVSNHFIVSPTDTDITDISLYAFATDRFSSERGPQPISKLYQANLRLDEYDPNILISAPVDGSGVVPGELVEIEVVTTDNTQGIANLTLSDNFGVVAERTGVYQQDDSYSFHYLVPKTSLAGDIILSVVSEDVNGRSAATRITLPIESNRPPELTFKSFSTSQKTISEPERVNYGEFWIRIGEVFTLNVGLRDDAALVSYEINRLNRDGTVFNEHSRLFQSSCPTLPVKYVANESARILFDQTEATEYEVIVEDNSGHITSRHFLIHPQANIAPEIRIITPSQDQYIVAGTFQIEVATIAADDRNLTGKLTLFANGVKLNQSTDGVSLTQGIEGATAVALDSIYDAFERKYDVEVANEFGRSSSDNVITRSFVFDVPSGLIRSNENIVLTAQIVDSEGAVGIHEISFIGAADEISPEVSLISPTVGYGPPESSDFTIRYRGFDNVKVSQLEIYSGYGAQLLDGSYQRLEFGVPLRTITDIQEVDHEPITTNNIDTLVYDQLIHVERLSAIANQFSGLLVDQVQRYDIWVRMVARDPSGNQRIREISFPVKIDERPVLDIIKPLDGGRVVEATNLQIGVNAYDDVGIDSLRMTARVGAQGSEIEISNILLRQPPYAFSVELPNFNQENPAQNRLVIEVFSIDSYGAAFNDPDQHTAVE
ncbi:MAG: hypothetical protein JKX81_03135, partial [Arenicella sp.]|nr:hypothetical protein [Arenicella sp.]